ncbi:hypothetical protein HK100_002222 [Physocladia obscura]|uniref:Uncharacterized protein n=1 Tax=Physocladia obscura TaxID=109957 RepID=A0AAD5XFK6_9FUNG|nr:hypothetical protein HK100_002222 [Physocladia obscura]
MKFKKAHAVQLIGLVLLVIILILSCSSSSSDIASLWKIANDGYNDKFATDRQQNPRLLRFIDKVEFEYATDDDETTTIMNLTVASISQYQVQFLDYLNGELEANNRSNVFGGSLFNNESEFEVGRTWRHVWRHALELGNTTYDRLDFGQLAVRARAHSILHRVLHGQHAYSARMGELLAELGRVGGLHAMEFDEELEAEVADKRDCGSGGGAAGKPSFEKQVALGVAQLERLLYAWLRPSFASVHGLQKAARRGSVGVVLTVGSRYFYVAQHLVVSLRALLNVTLPVEVYYGGGPDLGAARAAALATLPGVRVVNLHTVFPLETVVAGGWAHKAWAMLASRFETVLLMDADVVFLQDPVRAVLASPRFARDAVLFFHDRKLFNRASYDGIRLFKDMNPQLSARGARGLFARSDAVRGTTNEMESGFIAINKRDPAAFFALLLATKMNCQLERDEVLYKTVHGDKESFWFAAETMRAPYDFVPDYSGAIGVLENPTPSADNPRARICEGKPLHLDENSNPFWFHSGSVLSGNYRDAQPPDFSFSSLTDMVFNYDYQDEDEPWNEAISCISQPWSMHARLDATQTALIEAYKDLYRNSIIKVD